MSKTILFIDRNSIVRRSVLGGNIDPDRITPHIYTSQNKYILPVLGTVLYQKLQDDIQSGSLSGVYQTLVDDYITDALTHWSVVEYLPFSLYTVGQGGVFKYQVENTVSPNKSDIDFLLQKELQTAQFFTERLVKYLIANSATYPEYFEVTGKSDNIYANKSQQYKRSWVI